MKVEFDVRYGKNVVEIPVTSETKPKYRPLGMSDKYTDKVTIYNDIPSDGVNPRSFDRFVINKCLIYNRLSESADGTIGKVVNTQNVITKDVEHYKPPAEYAKLPNDIREAFYTVQVDDFVVLDEVDDVVTTSREFQEIQQKYKSNGFSVTMVNPYLKGSSTNNIHIVHA